MDKVKEFINKHKTELIIGTSLIFAYKLGFKRGCNATEKAVNNLFREAARTMNITKF